LTEVFIAQAVALVVYGLVNAASVAGGAWFGPLGWRPAAHGAAATAEAPASSGR
jgi:hypothetical protein